MLSGPGELSSGDEALPSYNPREETAFWAHLPAWIWVRSDFKSYFWFSSFKKLSCPRPPFSPQWFLSACPPGSEDSWFTLHLNQRSLSWKLCQMQMLWTAVCFFVGLDHTHALWHLLTWGHVSVVQTTTTTNVSIYFTQQTVMRVYWVSDSALGSVVGWVQQVQW